ncbi:MAG: DUF927 domain-containing protein [Firmicutes bacterium]|nr:DUF927 domain-containing protein [Bacillota bacterium]
MANVNAMEPQVLRRLGEVWPWPGLPEEARDVPVPPDLRLAEDGTWALRGGADGAGGAAAWRQIAAGPVALVGIEEDVDDHGLWLRLAWLNAEGRTECHAVPRPALGRRRPAAVAMAQGLPALLTRWAELADVLIQWEALAQLHRALPRRWRVGRPGWVETSRGIVFAAPGGMLGGQSQPVAPPDPRPGSDALWDGLGVAGRWEDERESMRRLLEGRPWLAWAMGHAAAAAGMRWWRRAGVTTLFGYVAALPDEQAATAALAPWGDPRILWPFRGTERGLAEALRARPDLPTAFAAPRPLGRPELSVLAEAVLEGGFRARMSPAGEVAAGPLWHGVVLWVGREGWSLAGGDAPPRWWLPAPAMPWEGAAGSVGSWGAAFSRHHGHGGRRAVQWVLREGGAEADGIMTVMRRLWERAMGQTEAWLAAHSGGVFPVWGGAQEAAVAGLAGLRLLAEGYAWDAEIRQLAEEGYRTALRGAMRKLEVQSWMGWREALEELGKAVADASDRIVDVRRREVAAVRLEDVVGAWVRPHGEPGPCLALDPHWVGQVLAARFGVGVDVDALARVWAAKGVLVLRPGGPGRRGSAAERVRYQYRVVVPGGEARPRGLAFRPRTPDGWRWLPEEAWPAMSRGRGA